MLGDTIPQPLPNGLHAYKSLFLRLMAKDFYIVNLQVRR